MMCYESLQSKEDLNDFVSRIQTTERAIGDNDIDVIIQLKGSSNARENIALNIFLPEEDSNPIQKLLCALSVQKKLREMVNVQKVNSPYNKKFKIPKNK